MRSAELFSGCGGLAYGMSSLGFEHVLMAEFNESAVATIKHNQVNGVGHVKDWPIQKTDVRNIIWSENIVDVVSGGPPCQPFGIGGKKLGQSDDRDMWPEVIRAIREAKPSAFVFENVRNLAGPKFRSYLEWIILSLQYPAQRFDPTASIEDNLEVIKFNGMSREFDVVWQVVNAADFGAAQIRYRVLIQGAKRKLGVEMQTLAPTHSRERLLWDQYVTGDYWERHGLERRAEPKNKADLRRVQVLRDCGKQPSGLPWTTVRDALQGLGKPNGRDGHDLRNGAKVYPGHTGSPLDLPSKALKAGDHGVPGGENMMVRDNGSVRYFSTREAARLVGLPDDFLFPGSWTESMRQLGNAVPTQLASAAAAQIKSYLVEGKNSAKVSSIGHAA